MTITATLTKEQLLAKIEEVTVAERITKEGLRILSRELLAFVFTTGDVNPINTLLGTDEDHKFRLTPLNWRTACLYFNNFVAFTSNFDKEIKAYSEKGDGQRVPMIFNKKSKPKYQRLLPTVTAWLEDENNDIWSWSKDNVEMQTKDAEYYLKNAYSAFKNALDEEKGGATLADVLNYMLEQEDSVLDTDELSEFLNPTE